MVVKVATAVLTNPKTYYYVGKIGVLVGASCVISKLIQNEIVKNVKDMLVEVLPDKEDLEDDDDKTYKSPLTGEMYHI